MNRTAALQLGATFWAACGIAVGCAAWPEVNSDARPVVATLAMGGVGCALAAAAALGKGARRLAGILLLCSAVTPTYFGYILALPALIVSAALAIKPKWVLGDNHRDQQQPVAV